MGDDVRRLLAKIVVTWAWFFLGPPLMIAVFSLAWGLPLEGTIDRLLAILRREPYLAGYMELAFVGLVPLLITLTEREDIARYGFRREGALSSVVCSSPLAGYTIIRGLPSEGYGLSFPWNVYYAALNLATYGPLEVFFVVWLIENTDELFGSKGVLSDGLILVSLIFGLSHALCPTCVDVVTAFLNALAVTAATLFLGAVYKYTRNILGFALTWTLVNRQAFTTAVKCFI